MGPLISVGICELNQNPGNKSQNNMRTLLKKPELHLVISQEDRGLKIEQAGRFYLAKNWQLSDDVLGTINLAFSYGLSKRSTIILDPQGRRVGELPAWLREKPDGLFSR